MQVLLRHKKLDLRVITENGFERSANSVILDNHGSRWSVPMGWRNQRQGQLTAMSVRYLDLNEHRPSFVIYMRGFISAAFRRLFVIRANNITSPGKPSGN